MVRHHDHKREEIAAMITSRMGLRVGWQLSDFMQGTQWKWAVLVPDGKGGIARCEYFCDVTAEQEARLNLLMQESAIVCRIQPVTEKGASTWALASLD